jgi:hypothetical protein
MERLGVQIFVAESLLFYALQVLMKEVWFAQADTVTANWRGRRASPSDGSGSQRKHTPHIVRTVRRRFHWARDSISQERKMEIAEASSHCSAFSTILARTGSSKCGGSTPCRTSMRRNSNWPAAKSEMGAVFSPPDLVGRISVSAAVSIFDFSNRTAVRKDSYLLATMYNRFLQSHCSARGLLFARSIQYA